MLDREKRIYHTQYGAMYHGKCEELLAHNKTGTTFEPINLIRNRSIIIRKNCRHP